MKAFSLIAIFLACLSGGNNIYSPQNIPVAEKGYLDLTSWSFNDQGFVYLNGEWEFYWKKLLPPHQPVNNKQKQYRDILENWSKKTRCGYATYKLKFKVKQSKRYAVYVPMIHVAHKLWIDGKLIGQNGVVGTDKNKEKPGIKNYIKELYLTEGIHHITIHVSNYVLDNAGVRLPLSFGNFEDLQNYRELKLFVEAGILGVILFMILSHFVAFLFNKKDYTNLYFIFLCICSFLLIAFRSERFFLAFFLSLEWEFLSKVGFMAIFSTPMSVFLFYRAINPIGFKKTIFWPIMAVYLLLIAYVCIFPSLYYSYVVPIFKVHALVIFSYVTLTAIKNLKTKKTLSSLIGIIGIVVCSIGMSGEVLYDNRVLSTSVLIPFYLFFLLTQSFLTAVKSFEAYKALEKSNERIFKQNLELNRLHKLKDEFLSNTTHELKTPLHGIIGIADALREDISKELSQKTKESLSIIINSAQRLSLLVNDILDIQRLKNKDIILDLDSFDLTQVINMVLSVSEPLLKNKPVELKSSIKPDLFFVYADSNRLYQIVQNFVSNSCKFTKSGSIEISAKEHGGLVYITVADTGIGVSVEDQERIFERFEQVGHSETGSGLGLNIAKKLIEYHGGSIDFSSTIDKGTRLTFTIPTGLQGKKIELKPMKKLKNIIESQAILETTAETITEQPQPLILVVDDEPINLKIVSDYLTTNNYQVKAVNGGHSALQYLETNKPSLVLLDIMMPEIDGYSVCKKIRKKYSHIEMPIIFLTAKNQPMDIVQGFSFGANDYLVKPFVKEELLARVTSLLAASRAKDRLIDLREFANKISSFMNIDVLLKETFNYITKDLSVDRAALFNNNKLVACSHSNEKKFNEIYHSAKQRDRYIQKGKDSYLLLRFKEMNHCAIIIKNKPGATPIDVEYFKALETQAEIIIKNFQTLIRDKAFLEDLNIIAKSKKHIRFIRKENKQTILFEDKEDSTIYLKSSLKTIECFFYKDLIRVNRFCLVNPKKIMGVNKSFNAKSKTQTYEINLDGEIINLSKSHFDNLPKKYKNALAREKKVIT